MRETLAKVGVSDCGQNDELMMGNNAAFGNDIEIKSVNKTFKELTKRFQAGNLTKPIQKFLLFVCVQGVGIEHKGST